MPTIPEYAQLADRVYARTRPNRTDVPIGWSDDSEPKKTPYANHCNDYLDGGDGADLLAGSGRNDTLQSKGVSVSITDWAPLWLGGATHANAGHGGMNTVASTYPLRAAKDASFTAGSAA